MSVQIFLCTCQIYGWYWFQSELWFGWFCLVLRLISALQNSSIKILPTENLFTLSATKLIFSFLLQKFVLSVHLNLSLYFFVYNSLLSSIFLYSNHKHFYSVLPCSIVRPLLTKHNIYHFIFLPPTGDSRLSLLLFFSFFSFQLLYS